MKLLVFALTTLLWGLGIIADGAQTNLLPAISGVLRDTNGSPVAGLKVVVYPQYFENGTNYTTCITDAEGGYRIGPYQSTGPSRFLLVRDAARNLATYRVIEEDTNAFDLQLVPALLITGQVQDEQGKPVTNAEVDVFLWNGGDGFGLCHMTNRIKADANGRYEIRGLPLGRRYSVRASAKGYGYVFSKPDDPQTNRFEWEPLVLKLADKKIAGVVVDSEERPCAGISVSAADEEGIFSSPVITNEKGAFVIDGLCEGNYRVVARTQSDPRNSGNIWALGGDTNCIIVLGNAFHLRRIPLVGKPLPDLSAVAFSPPVLQTNKPLLICLFDPEQRSSRHVMQLLTERSDSLKQKGVNLVGISAAIMTPDTLNSWKESKPFPVGGLTEKNDKTQWILKTEKFPWLILTDAQGRVKAEGFELDELDAKLK